MCHTAAQGLAACRLSPPPPPGPAKRAERVGGGRCACRSFLRLRQAVEVLVHPLQRVEGRLAGGAREGLLHAVLVAQEAQVLDPADAQEPEAGREVDVLALRVQALGALRAAAPQPALQRAHRRPREDLERPAEAEAAVHEEDAPPGRGAPAQVLAEPPGEEDRVGVDLHGPVVAGEGRAREDPLPDAEEDPRVQGEVVPGVLGHVQGAGDDLRPHGRAAQPPVRVAEDGVVLAAEDSRALLGLLLEEQHLVSV
mmetsp:Transcript_12222/g.34666  ORF Transcript_12222/g.34666 Transcript_12222/m.34666 type:complete len:254 (-) Transcript_12222:366-1127(-)